MTILGKHTVHELSDLWALYAYELDQLQGAGENAAQTWMAADNASAQAFVVAYNAARAAFDSYADQVTAFLADIGPDSTPTWDDWPAWSVTQGDLFTTVANAVGPLINQADRLFRTPAAPAAVAAMAPTYGSLPRPTAPDADLMAMQLSDTALKKVKEAAQLATSSTTMLALGVLLGIGVVIAIRK